MLTSLFKAYVKKFTPTGTSSHAVEVPMPLRDGGRANAPTAKDREPLRRGVVSLARWLDLNA
jgi:hypothetical protein